MDIVKISDLEPLNKAFSGCIPTSSDSLAYSQIQVKYLKQLWCNCFFIPGGKQRQINFKPKSPGNNGCHEYLRRWSAYDFCCSICKTYLSNSSVRYLIKERQFYIQIFLSCKLTEKKHKLVSITIKMTRFVQDLMAADVPHEISLLAAWEVSVKLRRDVARHTTLRCSVLPTKLFCITQRTVAPNDVMSYI